MKVLDLYRLLWVTTCLLLCDAQNTTLDPPTPFNQTTPENKSTSGYANTVSEASSGVTREPLLATSTAKVSASPTVYPKVTSAKPASTRTTNSVPGGVVYKHECLPLLLISGGLILVAVVLLMTTLVLSWKVCRLSSRVKTLSIDADLISNCDYWMGSAQRPKNRASAAKADKHVLLLEHIRLTQGEASNDVSEEEPATGKKEDTGDKRKESEGATAATEEKKNMVAQTENTEVVAADTSSTSEAAKDVV